MTVRKTVADELRDQELGVLSRRHAAIVGRLAQRSLPMKPVLQAMQNILDGNFDNHLIRGPFSIALQYNENFALPDGCYPQDQRTHCIRIPNDGDYVSRKIFFLKFSGFFTYDFFHHYIDKWGYRPVVSMEFVNLLCCNGIDALDYNLAALGSRYRSKSDNLERVLYSKFNLSKKRMLTWSKPEDLRTDDFFPVIEK